MFILISSFLHLYLHILEDYTRSCRKLFHQHCQQTSNLYVLQFLFSITSVNHLTAAMKLAYVLRACQLDSEPVMLLDTESAVFLLVLKLTCDGSCDLHKKGRT